jgi:pimeloyl-ACP methyl ester carboxylesterase
MRDDEFLMLQKSTIVRSYREGLMSPLLRLLGAGLSRLAPRLAARVAARLFLAPPRRRPPGREAETLAAARPGTLRVEGQRVRTWAWGAGPAILLVHGWAGRGAQLGAFVAPLLARGFSVVTFDAPGHGASDGSEANLVRSAAAIRTVAAAHGPLVGLVAHSVGAVAAARAMYEGLAAGAAVFVAPPADVAGPAAWFAEALGLSPRARDLMRARVEARVGVPWSAFEVARLAPALTSPLLVLHDRGDGEVPWQNGAVVARAWPGARLEATDGLGHRRILRDPGVVAAAVAFLSAHADGLRRTVAVGEPAAREVGAAA